MKAKLLRSSSAPWVVLLLGVLLLVPAVTFAQPFTFRMLDVQCDADATECPAGLTPGQIAPQTAPKGINARGDIVGVYVGGGRQHGFLYKNGQFTSIDFPLANVRATSANGINPQGEIVGQYVLPVKTLDDQLQPLPPDSPVYCPPDLGPGSPDPACIKAFHYARGTFTTIMFPTTADANGVVHTHPGAIAQRITPDGDIYGCLHDHNTTTSMYGAAWKRSFERSDVVVRPAFSLAANGGEVSDATQSSTGLPMSMNNGATVGGNLIGGLIVDMSGQQHGFLVQDGALTLYDPVPTANLTAIWDMNAGGEFVGTFRMAGEPGPKRHGFLQTPDLSPAITFDASFTDAAGNVLTAFSTVANGINPDGVIVGQYALVANGPAHGFIAVPVQQ